MNINPFPTLSASTIDAINVIGRWLAQDDFSGEAPYQADCVILAGNAVMPTIDAACKIARDQQIPLLISGGIGHSTTFCIAPSHSIRTTTLSAPLAGQKRPSLRISPISFGIFHMKKSGLKISQLTVEKMPVSVSHY